MANEDLLNYTGLQTKDFNVLLSDIQTAIQNIYSLNGEQINFESSSPDGQFTNVLAELGTVIRELLTEIYNSTSPSNCSGAVQDIRYQINNLFRKAGTFTIQNIDITTDRTVTLQGLDASYYDVNAQSYSVSDNAGNIFYLIDTATIPAGTTKLAFRAKDMGQVIPTVGTITNQDTIIAGILSVINSDGYTSLGEQQETDEEFRLRRERSVANVSTGNIDSIIGNILQLSGVTGINVWVNNSNSTDATGTQAHTIWVIVNGGAKEDIANLIYANIGGSETRGAVETEIATASGQPLTIRFDRPTVIPVYVNITIKSTIADNIIDLENMKRAIAESTSYNIGQDVGVGTLTANASYALDANGGGKTSFIAELKIANNEPNASISYSSLTITGATIDAEKFTNIYQTTGTYTLTYSGTDWFDGLNNINLLDYGITIEGEPSASDTLTITYTAPTWTDLLQVSTKADLYIIDASKIYTTIVDVS